MEPIGADIRHHANTKATALMRPVTGLAGLGFDALRHRDFQRRRKRQWTVGMIRLALSALIAGLLVYAGPTRKSAEGLVKRLFVALVRSDQEHRPARAE